MRGRAVPGVGPFPQQCAPPCWCSGQVWSEQGPVLTPGTCFLPLELRQGLSQPTSVAVKHYRTPQPTQTWGPPFPASAARSDRRRRYCAAHRGVGMVDVAGRLCQHPGCALHPTFAAEHETLARFCVGHKGEGMVGCVILTRPAQAYSTGHA